MANEYAFKKNVSRGPPTVYNVLHRFHTVHVQYEVRVVPGPRDTMSKHAKPIYFRGEVARLCEFTKDIERVTLRRKNRQKQWHPICCWRRWSEQQRRCGQQRQSGQQRPLGRRRQSGQQHWRRTTIRTAPFNANLDSIIFHFFSWVRTTILWCPKTPFCASVCSCPTAHWKLCCRALCNEAKDQLSGHEVFIQLGLQKQFVPKRTFSRSLLISHVCPMTRPDPRVKNSVGAFLSI